MAEGAAVKADAIGLDRIGAIGRVTLGPGPASAADWRAWTAAYDQWIADPNVYGALVRYSGAPLRDVAHATDLDGLADLYRLIWTIDRFSKPTVALLDGEMSWADFCLVRHGTHKVAGEGFRLDLTIPITGVFDAGATWWLSRLPEAIAETPPGRVIGAGDALALGLLTHHVSSASFDLIERVYADADPIDQVLDGLPQLSKSPGFREGSESAAAGVGLLRILIQDARRGSLKQTLERDYAIAMTRAEGGSADVWQGALARATAALGLKPPAGVPEALG